MLLVADFFVRVLMGDLAQMRFVANPGVFPDANPHASEKVAAWA